MSEISTTLGKWKNNLWQNRSLRVLLVLALLFSVGFLCYRPSVRYLALLVGIELLLVLMRQPALGLVAMAVFCLALPLEVSTGTDVSLTPPVLLIPIVALAWLANGLQRRSLWLPSSRTILPLILFLCSSLLSLFAGNAFWNPVVPRAGNLILIQIAQWGLFVLSAAIYVGAGVLDKNIVWLQRATWAFLITAAIAVARYYVPVLSALGGASYWFGADTSMFWVWLGALATGQLVFNRQLSSRLRFGLLALLLAATYISVFRMSGWLSGWGPFAVSVIGVLWLRLWRYNRRFALLVAVILTIAVVAFFPILFQHAGGVEEYETSWQGRLLLYKTVWNLVKTNPILGLGPANYRHYGFVQYLSLGPDRALYVHANISSHNNFIDIYAQTGIVGLFFFSWFLIALGRLAWRLSSSHPSQDFVDGYVQGALGGLAGTLVAMMLVDWFLPFVYNVGFSGFRTSSLAWMFLGGLVAIEQADRSRQAES